MELAKDNQKRNGAVRTFQSQVKALSRIGHGVHGFFRVPQGWGFFVRYLLLVGLAQFPFKAQHS